MHIPAFAGVGVDDDGRVGGRAKFCNQGCNQCRMRAIHADGGSLRKCRDGCGTMAEQLAVGNVLAIATSEREPRGEFRV